MESDEPKNLPECHILKLSAKDLEYFINWVDFHRSEWTDDEIERYYTTIEQIVEKLAKTGGHIRSWLQQILLCLLEEQEARKLCRELIKDNLVTID